MELNQEAVEALRAAIRQLGLENNHAEVVRRLKEYVGDSPADSTLSRWLKDPGHPRHAIMPAWALIAASRVAQVPLDALLNVSGMTERMARFEQELEDLKRRLAGDQPGLQPTE